jgi:23S rRNA (guanine2445-N2)-methyltransferase / 23S rRNA (guanine2069-N7)-methyltransferase
MCGSGTLLIEGGLIAARKAPAMGMDFAIERWPSLRDSAREILRDLRAEAKAQERTVPCPIVGTDRDDESVVAAKKNAGQAGLGTAIQVEVGDAISPRPFENLPPGLIVTNPPYGDRLTGGGQKGMKTFYFQLGDSIGKMPGWRLAILSGNPAFESAFHHRPSGKRELWNGPIQCELLTYPPPTTEA